MSSAVTVSDRHTRSTSSHVEKAGVEAAPPLDRGKSLSSGISGPQGCGSRVRMVDFSFTEAQQEFARVVSSFALEELAPKYAHWDRTGEFPAEQWRKMGQLG